MRDYRLITYQGVAELMGKNASHAFAYMKTGKMPKPDAHNKFGSQQWYLWRIWEWSDRHAHNQKWVEK